MAIIIDSLKRQVQIRTDAWRGLIYLPIATSLAAVLALTLNITQRIEVGPPKLVTEIIDRLAVTEPESQVERLTALTMARHRAITTTNPAATISTTAPANPEIQGAFHSSDIVPLAGNHPVPTTGTIQWRSSGQSDETSKIPNHAGTALPLTEFPEPAAGPEQVLACDAFDAPLDQVARDLMDRKRRLDERSQEIELQTEAMHVMRDQLEADIKRLEQVRDELKAAVEEVDEAEESRLKQLVKVYESMKSKKAAEIFDRLGLDIIIPVATRMREAKLADILAAMNPDRARLVTSKLATELPRQSN